MTLRKKAQTLLVPGLVMPTHSTYIKTDGVGLVPMKNFELKSSNENFPMTLVMVCTAPNAERPMNAQNPQIGEKLWSRADGWLYRVSRFKKELPRGRSKIAVFYVDRWHPHKGVWEIATNIIPRTDFRKYFADRQEHENRS